MYVHVWMLERGVKDSVPAYVFDVISRKHIVTQFSVPATTLTAATVLDSPT